MEGNKASQKGLVVEAVVRSSILTGLWGVGYTCGYQGIFAVLL